MLHPEVRRKLKRLGWKCPHERATEFSSTRRTKDMTDDLAGEFQRVDAASDFAVFSNCLTSDQLASVFRRVQAREL